MNRNEFIIATAIILFTAFLLGWFVSWLIHRLGRVTRAEMGELENMARQLHEAEEARDQAVRKLEEREGELIEQLGRSEVQLQAAQGELKETHLEIEELRAFIDRKLGRHG